MTGEARTRDIRYFSLFKHCIAIYVSKDQGKNRKIGIYFGNIIQTTTKTKKTSARCIIITT